MADNTKTDNATPGNGGEQVDRHTIDPDQVDDIIPGSVDDVGRRIITFISPRDFATQEQCLALVVGKPRGWQQSLGRIAGYATKAESRESSLPLKPGEKQPPASIWIGGQFESVSIDGEIKTAPWVILPRAAGELIAEAFANGAQSALLDLEIGVEATGRSIPYAWSVRAYNTRQTEAQRIVSAIRARQEARAQARLAAPAGPEKSS